MKVSLNLNSPHSAFTLVEVLMILGLLTLCMGTIARMQVRSLNRLEQDKDALQKIYLVRRTMLDALKIPNADRLRLVKKEYQDGEIKVKTTLHDLSKKSKISSFSKNMRMLSTQASWQLRPGDKQQAQLVYFMYLPAEEKKK